jgi:hypothetical protein
MTTELKAFAVELTTFAVVMAKDRDHAAVVAEGMKRIIQEDDSSPLITVGLQIVRAEDAGRGWSGHCIPYGGDGNTRLDQLLAQPINLPTVFVVKSDDLKVISITDEQLKSGRVDYSSLCGHDRACIVAPAFMSYGDAKLFERIFQQVEFVSAHITLILPGASNGVLDYFRKEFPNIDVAAELRAAIGSHPSPDIEIMEKSEHLDDKKEQKAQSV